MKRGCSIVVPIIVACTAVALSGYATAGGRTSMTTRHDFNGPYSGDNLNYIAFPIGGIGAGMFCLEGTGGISHMSIRNKPEIRHDPVVFGALTIKSEENVARVLEGSVPKWKLFGQPNAGAGLPETTYGLPRFEKAVFRAQFPFAEVSLADPAIPLDVTLKGWSPFVPGDPDSASLPVGALEYRFENPTKQAIDAAFSFHSSSFLAFKMDPRAHNFFRYAGTSVETKNGFVSLSPGGEDIKTQKGAFCVTVDENAVVNREWFRGGIFDSLTVTWDRILKADHRQSTPGVKRSTGASIHVPFKLKPGEIKTVRVLVSWYFPKTKLQVPKVKGPDADKVGTYAPWYAGQFEDIEELHSYWASNYEDLRRKSQVFSESFFDTTLPPEAVEAVSANLSILKTTTVLRQTDGRFWGWEGSHDEAGSCAGSCTHVYNYAQAMPHLFPSLERTLRETEFLVSQDETGHQVFRTALPIRPSSRKKGGAADGQLGTIMRAYREWRISGDAEWMKNLWPRIRSNIDYCIRRWDPGKTGVLTEVQGNTYDIAFWGPNGMCTSMYLGALAATVEMGQSAGQNVDGYKKILESGRAEMERGLYNGEYFHQVIPPDMKVAALEKYKSMVGEMGTKFSPEIIELVEKEGPPYQYGTGCLSDAILGAWMAKLYGLGDILDGEKVRSTLESIHRYNFREDLSRHANAQRPGFALAGDGGLLLCTWPKGDKVSLPFPYSNEVWTGIEYQVASHLIMEGMVDKGLEIVRTCRNRYDGVRRNPFDEFEAGHFYARAMSSYSLLQSLSGVRYDAVDKTLYIDSKVGDNFRSFLSTATGFGTVGLKDGKPFVEMAMGRLDVSDIDVAGEKIRVRVVYRAE